MARSPGILRQVEPHLATLRPLGAQGHMAQTLRGFPRPGPGVAGPRLHRRACPPHAAGARKSSGGQDAQSLGRSRGGFGTKVHVAVSGLLLPVVLLLSPGQQADVSHAKALLAGVPAGSEVKAVIADKGYDSKAVVEAIQAMGAEAVIPSLSTRKEQRDYDKDRYKDRNLVERFWQKVKQFRRVATRYEKTGRNFLVFVQVASLMVLLR